MWTCLELGRKWRDRCLSQGGGERGEGHEGPRGKAGELEEGEVATLSWGGTPRMEETQSGGAPGRRLGHTWCKGLWNQRCIYFFKNMESTRNFWMMMPNIQEKGRIQRIRAGALQRWSKVAGKQEGRSHTGSKGPLAWWSPLSTPQAGLLDQCRCVHKLWPERARLPASVNKALLEHSLAVHLCTVYKCICTPRMELSGCNRDGLTHKPEIHAPCPFQNPLLTPDRHLHPVNQILLIHMIFSKCTLVTLLLVEDQGHFSTTV